MLGRFGKSLVDNESLKRSRMLDVGSSRAGVEGFSVFVADDLVGEEGDDKCVFWVSGRVGFPGGASSCTDDGIMSSN